MVWAIILGLGENFGYGRKFWIQSSMFQVPSSKFKQCNLTAAGAAAVLLHYKGTLRVQPIIIVILILLTPRWRPVCTGEFGDAAAARKTMLLISGTAGNCLARQMGEA